ncbi:MAG: UbiA family prenyltransferase [Melioribacteraceae bacterium]|nr:UbiA family prenyltransferase [Melioribacteraceae bacterium]
MKKVNGLLRLIRFELPFSAGICVVMGQLLALGKFASLFEITAGFLSVFAISASILVLNDYFDVETDKINAPDRPIASNLVTPYEALIFSILLLLIGLLLSYFLSTPTFISAIILLIIGFLYNWRFKKSGLPGNLMVSFSVGMTFVYGGVSVGLPFNKIAWFFGIISALIDLGEEIAADSMDMEGDKLINSNSLAIKYGRDTALNISGFIFLIVILLTMIPFILKWFTLNYLIPIIIIDFSIAFSMLKLLNSEGDEGRKYIRRIYLGATLGLIVFILMRYFNL